MGWIHGVCKCNLFMIWSHRGLNSRSYTGHVVRVNLPVVLRHFGHSNAAFCRPFNVCISLSATSISLLAIG